MDKFNEIRKSITVYDYEIYYTTREETDFNNSKIYKKIVDDLDKGICILP
ncbi:MAG: hypothetical protein GX675_02980 [Erysipelotrichaceae bacterium]|nr:hypothetical protein [Erysipelotrichaceae bacterium]